MCHQAATTIRDRSKFLVDVAFDVVLALFLFFSWFRLNSFSIPRHVLKRVKSNCSVTRPCHDVWKQFDRPQYHRHFDDTLSCGNLCLTLSFSKIASPHRIGRIKCLIEMKTHSGWQPANNAVHSTMNRSRRLSNFDAQYKRTKDFS